MVKEPGLIALLSGAQLELLAEMDVELLLSMTAKSKEVKFGDREFLEDLQKAADRHLLEKNEIRDAVGLLKLYHKAGGSGSQGLGSEDSGSRSRKTSELGTSSGSGSSTKVASPRKRSKTEED